MTNAQFPTPAVPASLPITDHERLRAALEQGDIPTLLMVYTRLSKDDGLLDRFAPFIASIFEPPREMPAELVEELRERLFALLTRTAPPEDTPPDDALFRRMLKTCVGEPVGDEFIPMLNEQMGFDLPERRSQRQGRREPPQDFKVLVIGAGLTGLLAAIKLHEAGYRFQLVDKNPEIGGTWWENTYPGCGVDTPSHFYSYSFELNPDWSHYTPSGREFQEYLLGVAEKYDLRRHVLFDTRVTQCRFDELSSRWQITVEDENGRRELEANAVINAHGPLNRWQWPDIKGLQGFEGTLLHTAAWDHSVSLEGKRVVLLGTGASGVQVGTAIADKVAQLTVIQRSRHWVMPNHYVEVPEVVRWAQRNIPHYAAWFRFRAFWFAADGLFENIRIDPDWPHQERSISALNDAVREYCLQNYRTKLADRPDLMERLVPDYPVFGKRIVMDIGWLDTLCRDNVNLECGNIDHVEADAVVMADGRRIEADAIVCATGFDTSNMVGSLEVIGRDGRNLKREWQDDPRAYLGVAIPGYPNYFITVGPNSAPNHAGGQNITSESQIHYILECLELLNERGAAILEPTQAACDRFNAEVDEALQGLIWLHPRAPHSYYKNRKGRNFMSCPYRLVDYWWMTRKPTPEDFEFDYGGDVVDTAPAAATG
ncbi:MAG: NAD(P)/FAD-dependent oxidoreductase [Pseudomonadales bacterium]|nr:NAD(P)/FAD-dependent oxidoreductase [Pseudomonadales bacterium]MCP5190277.1 NAD(P)/FAD-dependent oxidoreductase [Pseudomonadales bacterium]